MTSSDVAVDYSCQLQFCIIRLCECHNSISLHPMFSKLYMINHGVHSPEKPDNPEKPEEPEKSHEKQIQVRKKP